MPKFFPSMKVANTACFMSIMAIENAFQRTACGKLGPKSPRYDKPFLSVRTCIVARLHGLSAWKGGFFKT